MVIFDFREVKDGSFWEVGYPIKVCVSSVNAASNNLTTKPTICPGKRRPTKPKSIRSALLWKLLKVSIFVIFGGPPPNFSEEAAILLKSPKSNQG